MTQEMMEIEYNRARTLLSSNELEKLEEARDILISLNDYKDSPKFLDEAKLKINNLLIEIEEKKEEDYERAILLMKEKKSAQRLDQAIKLFKMLDDYKDSKELLEECIKKRKDVSVKDKRDLDKLRLMGYLFAGIGVVFIAFVILAVIWSIVSAE